MAQTQPKDNPPQKDETVKELVEALATAYFGACRKLARALNRRRRS